MTAGQDSIAGTDLDTFYLDLQNAHLRPLWKPGPDLLPLKPPGSTWPPGLRPGRWKQRFSGSAAEFRALPDMGAVFFANAATLPQPESL